MPEEDRRSPSQASIDNSLAIAKLVTLQEQTTKDVDKLVNHIEKLLPINEKINGVHDQLKNLRYLVYALASTSLMFATWSTMEIFEREDAQHTHEEVDNTITDHMTYRINKLEEISHKE